MQEATYLPIPAAQPGTTDPLSGRELESRRTAGGGTAALGLVVMQKVAGIVGKVAGKTVGTQPSAAACRLVEAQKQRLGDILADVRSAGPQQYRKRGHWAWYVWPTAKEGMSDPQNTAVKSVTDVVHVLSAPSLPLWVEVLEALTESLRVQRSTGIFPSIDHGRIEHFILEWSSAGHRDAMQRTPNFASAVDSFAQAWNAAGGRPAPVRVGPDPLQRAGGTALTPEPGSRGFGTDHKLGTGCGRGNGGSLGSIGSRQLAATSRPR